MRTCETKRIMTKIDSRHFAVSFAALLALACVTSAPSTQPPAAAPIVVAGGERLQGAFVGSGSTEAVFRGIPYAAPPVGDRRWKPPAPITPREGVQQATAFAPACMQSIAGSASFYRNIVRTLGHDPQVIPELKAASEDCLYLNVWTTSLGAKERKPVMVWIHGGANVAGTPAAFQTDGATLARKGVVVVSLGYRLGVFGYLAHPALSAESEHASSGNYAQLDQIAALRWVQENIAAFGGDPGRVTVFGESAGATNIGYLLATPLARGLFHRAIIQSGGYAVSDFRSLSDAEAAGSDFSATLPPGNSTDVLAGMRATPPEELLRAWFAMKRQGLNAPNIDGWVLPTAAAITFNAGKQNHVPLIVGFNRDEWRTLRGYSPNITADAFRQLLRTVYGSLGDRAAALYPVATDADAVDVSDRWQTDWYFACPSRFIADRMSRSGDDAYVYLFSRTVQAPGGETLGAYHAAEIPYVWDTLEKETWVARQPWDHELAQMMSAAWVRFAATGNPNGGTLPAWPVFRGGEERFLEFGDTVRTGSGVRKSYCDLYEELLASRIGGDQ